MFDNLSARQVRSKVETGIIRILEESQLDAVRKVFGVSFGVGVCFPVPSLKMVKANVGLKPTIWLRNMDPVRIVSCLPEECDLEPNKPKPPLAVSNDDDEISSGKKRRRMKLLCSYRGLDIKYSTSMNCVAELSVQCRFVKVRGDSNAVHKIHERIVSDGESQSDSSSSNLQVEVGDYIKVDGRKVYEVKEITDAGVVRCESPTHAVNAAIELTIQQANYYFQQFGK
jgi:hypothetical protein